MHLLEYVNTELRDKCHGDVIVPFNDMMVSMEVTEFRPGEKKSHSLLRIWKTLTAVSSLIALVVTVVLIWYVVTRKSAENNCGQPSKNHAGDNGTQRVSILACPQLPTLFPLAKPTPKRIQHVFEEIESVLRSLVEKESSLPAISMNIFYKDDILWSGHFGSKVYNHSEMKPNGSTVYRIGSVTKIFAVLLMYKLYEDGKISSIDDPLSKYAPDFAITNPYTNENITLREIASQMSGLSREAPCMFSCNTTSAEQLVLLRNRTLVLPPWNTPSYSNLGYALLGRLLTENVLNQTFESWTIENIIKPLGMVNTGFEITNEVQKNMAFPYLLGGRKMPFMDLGWLAPTGQMYSTIDDLAKLGMMFAQPDKQKLFKPATLREMMTPKDITPDGFTVWGSPFEMVFKEHVLVRAKAGNIDTYSATFSVVPELALGANILISTTYYLQASKEPTLLYNLLVPRLNETLFEMQRDSNFSIDPAPFVGNFQLTTTDPIFGRKATFIITINIFGNILRFVNPQFKESIEIRYIGEGLVFQARHRTPGMTCATERIGALADLYFDPPGDADNLSPGFRVPGWSIFATRINANSGRLTKGSENNPEGFSFTQFKSAI